MSNDILFLVCLRKFLKICLLCLLPLGVIGVTIALELTTKNGSQLKSLEFAFSSSGGRDEEQWSEGPVFYIIIIEVCEFESSIVECARGECPG